jgi:hypothetical protein
LTDNCKCGRIAGISQYVEPFVEASWIDALVVHWGVQEGPVGLEVSFRIDARMLEGHD